MAAIAPLKDLPAEQKLSAIEENDEELGSETEEYTSEDSEDHEEDGDDDPLFDPVEETLQSLSNLSLKKTRRRVSVKEDIYSGDDVEEAAKLDPKDEKSYDLVEKMIKDGKLEKLKVDQCKLYLRKHGLRLTGKKEVLLARVREHLEIVDGGGEKKYPVSSFTVNCQGDACMGDVVMFEQNVYEMFSIASRSATGPPCGTRTVAGRIVKESYGAAKQQHTFTIEVLWSKGEKPLPPLHPLLIKGRNLYRLKTMRQRWPNEGERKQVLQEKHMRGSSARFSREVRIQKKEARKLGGMKRTAENQGTIGANRMKQSNQLTVQNPRTKDTIVDNDISSQSLRAQGSDVSVWPVQQNSGKNSCNSRQPLKDFNFIQKQTTKASVLKQPILSSPPRYSYNYCKQPIMRLVPRENVSYPPHSPRYGHRQPFSFAYNQPTANLSSLPHSPRNGYNNRPPYGGCTDRQTLEYLNSQPHSSRNGYGNTNHPTQRQPCPYYPLGRCRYMDNCKFLHQ